MELLPGTKIVIVGHTDVVEGALRAYFAKRGFLAVFPVASFDPLSAAGTRAFMERERPQAVILASVRSGGIGINQACPAEFIHDNLAAQVNVIDSAYRAGVQKLLFLAASCVYPRECPQPMKEEAALTGPMEPTSLSYSMAKAAGMVMCQAYRQQYGFNAIVAVPATVYAAHASVGEDVAGAHVLGALIGKFDRAVREKRPSVELWGTGSPRREFIFGEDLGAACEFLLEHYDGSEIVNVGAGEDIAIRDLAAMVAASSGFKGEILWDTTKPDGAPRKLLDTARLRKMGWAPRISLNEGIDRTFQALRKSR